MRNLVVCCDGTWNTAEQRHDGVPVPTNVVRLYNSLAEKNDNGIEQRMYYHPGVGTEPGWWDRTMGGATGKGLDENIMSAYHWLCRNYRSRDRIFLFGFSRGAYTVRSLAGMIGCCGLLKLDNVKEDKVKQDGTWRRVEHVFRKGYREHSESVSDWKKKKWEFHTTSNSTTIPIHMIGVWDTVGALGIPDDLALLNLLDASDEHAFHDTSLGSSTRHARHAVALDEIRASFRPTLWTGQHPDLEQVWFPGVHCDVGGGYRETGLSDGALKWMIDEAKALGLGVDTNMEKQVKPDSRGVLHESYTDMFKLLPNLPRSAPRLDFHGASSPELHNSVTERRENPPISHAPYRPTVPLLKAGESRAFPIYALKPWNETGLYLEAGTAYVFAASGEWLDRSIHCGPDGTNDGDFQPAELAHLIGSALGELENLFQKATKNRDANFRFSKRHERLGGERVPWFCLIGAIANGGGVDEQGKPGMHETFRIGSGASYKPQKSGYLYAYANDAWNFYENNRGSVTLTVRR
jgi:uncharacterized protein (DUF2235 family)